MKQKKQKKKNQKKQMNQKTQKVYKKNKWTRICVITILIGMVLPIFTIFAFSPIFSFLQLGKIQAENAVVSPTEDGVPYAIIVDSNTLVFANLVAPEVGDTYKNGNKEGMITAVYKNFMKEPTEKPYEDVLKESDEEEKKVPWADKAKYITAVRADSPIAPKSMKYWFEGFRNCFRMDLSLIDVSNITNMEDMFSSCSNLYELNISGWNTENVTNMNYMFRNCVSLDGIDVSSFNTSKVKSMRYMFDGCSHLSSLDISGWDISSLKDVTKMFRKCEALTLDCSGWDISNISSFESFGEDAPGVISPFPEEEKENENEDAPEEGKENEENAK